MIGSQLFQSDLAIELGIECEEDLAQPALGMGPDDAESLVRRARVVALLRGPIRPDIGDGGGKILRTERGCFIAPGLTGPFDGLALERDTRCTQGTTRRLPEAVRQGSEAFQTDAFARGQARSGRTEYQQGADRHRPRTARFQGREGPADRGPRVDDVVHDRDDLATDDRPDGLGNAVADGIQAIALRSGELLGEGELDIELLGHHLRQECSLDQGATDRLDAVRGEPPSQLGRERPEADGLQVKPGDLQPEFAVVTRLQPEVPRPRCQQAEEFFLHRLASQLVRQPSQTLILSGPSRPDRSS